jgi:cellulose synthase/poly-beta-1,6-N-acetylglucosamine synthase-like glycosyltransferase
MSVYNGERYLREAVESILNQTFADLEFIIIDDGSTDRSHSILKSYSDPRLIVVRREHLGRPQALNCGLALARGEYVAILDADDVSLPLRLEEQTEFLDRHPDVAIVGTYYWVLDRSRRVRTAHRPPCDDLHIRWTLLLGSAFAHSTAMYRRSVIQNLGGYNERFELALDYELWSRLVREFRGANIPQFLVKWMDNPTGLSSRGASTQQRNRLLVSQANIRALLSSSEWPLAQVTQLAAIHDYRYNLVDLAQAPRTFRNYATLYHAFCRHHREELVRQRKVLAGIRREYCQKLLGPAHYYCDLGQRPLAPRLMWQAVQAEPGVLVEPSAWRLLIKLALGTRATALLRRYLPRALRPWAFAQESAVRGGNA